MNVYANIQYYTTAFKNYNQSTYAYSIYGASRRTVSTETAVLPVRGEGGGG